MYGAKLCDPHLAYGVGGGRREESREKKIGLLLHQTCKSIHKHLKTVSHQSSAATVGISCDVEFVLTTTYHWVPKLLKTQYQTLLEKH